MSVVSEASSSTFECYIKNFEIIGRKIFTIHLPKLANYGWDTNLEIEWIVLAFPSELENLLTELEEETTIGEDEDSEDENDLLKGQGWW